MAGRVYLTHFSRGPDCCPLCEASLVWRRVGERKWCPCDKRPVICMWDASSPLRAVYRGEIVRGVKILHGGNTADFVGNRTFYALQPHVFTCSQIPHLTSFRAYEKYR